MDQIKYHPIQQWGLLLFTFVIYALSGIISKQTSLYIFLSWSYLCGLFGALFTLGLYAILWQKILSFMLLNKAFLCKSMTILMVLAVSAFFFKEQVTLNNIIGSAVIIVGLVVLVWKE